MAECGGCPAERLNDAGALALLLRRAADAAGVRVVAEVFHAFAPQGVTGVLVIEESHLSIHTWPEFGSAAIDFYTCGRGDLMRALSVMTEGLGATTVRHQCVERAFVASRDGAPHDAVPR